MTAVRQMVLRRGAGAVLAAGVAVAAGCSQSTQLETSSVTTTVPTESAFAFPAPGGPSITGVLQRSYSNAIEQDILLSNAARASGQNMLRVQLFGSFDQAPLNVPSLGDKSPAGPSIASEMRKLLPGVRMARSSSFVQNKYGPFGYAIGSTSAGDTCLYGWQRIAAATSRQTLFGNRGAIQIRLRLCDASAAEEELLQAMYGYTIVANVRGGNWNPYGDASPVNPAYGQAHAPIYPVVTIAPTGLESPRATATQPAAAPTQRRRSPRAPEPEPSALPAPVGPIVPPPPTLSPAGGNAAPVVSPPPSSQPSAASSGVVVPSPPLAPAAASDSVIVPPPP